MNDVAPPCAGPIYFRYEFECINFIDSPSFEKRSDWNDVFHQGRDAWRRASACVMSHKSGLSGLSQVWAPAG